MTNRTLASVIALVAETLDVPPATLSASSSMATVPQWDSIAHLNICLAFQERFGIEMEMETIARSTSIEALAALASGH